GDLDPGGGSRGSDGSDGSRGSRGSDGSDDSDDRSQDAAATRRGPAAGRGGATALADSRCVALLLMLVTVGSLAASPVTNLVSRRIEASADRFSLELTRDPADFAAMQRRLAVSNVSDLRPRWYRTALYQSHPDPAWRIAMARAWAEQHDLPGPQPVGRPLPR
ncbi:M48 family metalloprotease, partial [Angustibacter aerolatus]